jgi:hypothetical protein
VHEFVAGGFHREYGSTNTCKLKSCGHLIFWVFFFFHDACCCKFFGLHKNLTELSAFHQLWMSWSYFSYIVIFTLMFIFLGTGHGGRPFPPMFIFDKFSNGPIILQND